MSERPELSQVISEDRSRRASMRTSIFGSIRDAI